MRFGEALGDLPGDQRTGYQPESPVQQREPSAHAETQERSLDLVPRFARDVDDGPLQDRRLGERVARHEDQDHLKGEREDVLRSPHTAVPRLEHAAGRGTDYQKGDQRGDDEGEDDREQVRVGHEAFDIPDTQRGDGLHDAAAFGFVFVARRLWLFGIIACGLRVFARH